MGEITEFTNHYRGQAVSPVNLEMRARFNPTLNKS